MNYIYDILINWNKELFDFYEWNLNDDISHIRKIPIFKVSSDVLLEMVTCDFCASSEFLSKIYNKTEMFTNKNMRQIEYASLFSDGEEVIAIHFSSTGASTYKSKLLIDEANEVTEVVIRVPEVKIDYNIIKENPHVLKTRKELRIEKYLKKELENLKKDYAFDKLKYLYYECFGEKEANKEQMIGRLKKSLKEDWHHMYVKMYDFFKLASSHR